MKKTLSLFIVCLMLCSCNAKTPTESIVDASVDRIERAQQAVKNTDAIEQCKTIAIDALLSAKTDVLNIGKSCNAEISMLKADVIRWQGYFWLLFTGVAIMAYLFVIKKVKNLI